MGREPPDDLHVAERPLAGSAEGLAVAHRRQEHQHGEVPAAPEVRLDRGERRFRVLADVRRVVDAQDRNVIRNGDSAQARRRDDVGRDGIRRGEDRTGFRKIPEERLQLPGPLGRAAGAAGPGKVDAAFPVEGERADESLTPLVIPEGVGQGRNVGEIGGVGQEELARGQRARAFRIVTDGEAPLRERLEAVVEENDGNGPIGCNQCESGQSFQHQVYWGYCGQFPCEDYSQQQQCYFERKYWQYAGL